MINIKTFDLNLIKVFDAILRHGSVSAAAKELNLTQPGVSNALTRLRTISDDDLFVRTREGMQPTNYALEMATSLKEGLELINFALLRTRSYEAATSARRFTLLMTDAGEIVFLPGFMKGLRTSAPRVNIDVKQFSVDHYVEALESGEADLAIGNVRAISEDLYYSKLFEDPYVLVCRRGHKLFQRAASQEAYAQADHVVVSPPNSPDDAVRDYLNARGIQRRIALSVPHFMVLGPIIGATDLVATVTGRVARAIPAGSNTKVLELPFPVKPVTIGISWHRRYHRDPGNLWLRRLLAEGVRVRAEE